MDQAVYISLHANALWKYMYLSVLCNSSYIDGQTGFFSFGKAISLGKRKLCIQTNCTLFKKIHLESHPARCGGVMNIHTCMRVDSLKMKLVTQVQKTL